MSDPYAPQPQQPYNPQQPYQQQPYPQQPYQQQPYQQPQQPSYQEPQQSYPYPQQPYANPYAPVPQPGFGQEPPKKRRTGLIVTIVVAVFALAACAGIAVIALKPDKSKTTSTGTTTGTPAAPTDSATPSAAPKAVTLAAPATLDGYKKAADQSRAKTMSGALANAGLDHPYAEVYQDKANPARTVTIWGGTGAIFDAGTPQQQLNSFFTSAGSGMGGVKPSPVSPGSIGGVADCGQADTGGIKFSLCAWIAHDVLLGFIFTGLTPTAAAAKMRAVLPSIVVKG